MEKTFKEIIDQHNLSSDDIAEIMGFKNGLSYQGSSNKLKRQKSAEYFYNLGLDTARKAYETKEKEITEAMTEKIIEKFRSWLGD